MDDTRPLRDHLTDKELPVLKFIEYCNKKLNTSMRFATPDELFDELSKYQLPQITGVIDRADVCYNGPFGSNNLATLRIKAEQQILAVEMINAIFDRKDDFEFENVKSNSNHFYGEMNQAKHLLNLETTNGNIKIRKIYKEF